MFTNAWSQGYAMRAPIRVSLFALAILTIGLLAGTGLSEATGPTRVDVGNSPNVVGYVEPHDGGTPTLPGDDSYVVGVGVGSVGVGLQEPTGTVTPGEHYVGLRPGFNQFPVLRNLDGVGRETGIVWIEWEPDHWETGNFHPRGEPVIAKWPYVLPLYYDSIFVLSGGWVETDSTILEDLDQVNHESTQWLDGYWGAWPLDPYWENWPYLGSLIPTRPIQLADQVDRLAPNFGDVEPIAPNFRAEFWWPLGVTVDGGEE